MKKIISLILVFLSLTICAAEKDWTTIVYMNADNNLCRPFSDKDLAEMRTIDVSEKSNLIVVYDCSSFGDSKILEMHGDKGDKVIDFGYPAEFDMGDYKFLADVSKKIFKAYPSEKKMLIIWNHGSGWNFTNKPLKGISYDDQSGHHITTLQTEKAIKDITSETKLDILGYDACLMQMIEVAYQTHEYVDYVMGSEYSEPGDGWDYTGIVKAMDLREKDPVKFGEIIIDQYVDFYSQETEEREKKVVQLSILDSHKLPYLVEEIKLVIPALREVKDLRKIVSSSFNVYYSHKDLGTFINLLPINISSPLKSAYDQVVLYSKNNSGETTGLAQDFSYYGSSAYKELKFEKDSGFKAFLSTL